MEQPLRHLIAVQAVRPSTMQGKKLISLGPDFSDIHVDAIHVVEDWDNPHPVAVLLQPVWDGLRLGLVIARRVKGPGTGRFALPAGFMKKHESARAAALREFAEESGFPDKPNLFGSERLCHVIAEEPTSGGQLLVFVQNPQRMTSADVLDLRDTDEMANWQAYYGPGLGDVGELAFPLHTRIADRWLELHRDRETPNQAFPFWER